MCTPKFYAILDTYHWRDMEFIFILLAAFFIVLLYVVPAIILIGVFALIIRGIVNKFADHGEPNDFDAYNDSVCPICGDDEEWHRHAP